MTRRARRSASAAVRVGRYRSSGVKHHPRLHNSKVRSVGAERWRAAPFPRFLSPAEVWKLADAIRPDPRALILLGAFGGLRIGEMAGLRRGRVDLERGTVQVIEIITEPRGHLHFGPPRPAPAGGRLACPGSWSRL